MVGVLAPVLQVNVPAGKLVSVAVFHLHNVTVFVTTGVGRAETESELLVLKQLVKVLVTMTAYVFPVAAEKELAVAPGIGPVLDCH